MEPDDGIYLKSRITTSHSFSIKPPGKWPPLTIAGGTAGKGRSGELGS